MIVMSCVQYIVIFWRKHEYLEHIACINKNREVVLLQSCCFFFYSETGLLFGFIVTTVNTAAVLHKGNMMPPGFSF